MTKRRRRARPAPTIRTVRTVTGPVIEPRVPAYARLWHTVDDWAYAACANLGDVEAYVPRDNDREAGWRGSWVRDIENEETAFDEGIPIWEGIEIVPPGPPRDDGGTRRVSIRFYTWTLDEAHGAAYEPAWITTGWGMSARAATLAHYRYLREYANQVAMGRQSRKLLAVAIEIVFWTASASAHYV